MAPSPHSGQPRGQTVTELALVMPLLMVVLLAMIILGIGVFYQQQVTNAAREAARYAAIHSATAQCPTVPRLPFDPASPPLSYVRCDRPESSWPRMTGHARSAIFGLDRSSVHISACWSGYRKDAPTGAWDAPPPGTYDSLGTISSVFVQCQIDGHDPTVDAGSIGCTSGLSTSDQASAISEAQGRPVANTVTAYVCYRWSPPLAGFLLIPATIDLRAVITEAIQRQQ